MDEDEQCVPAKSISRDGRQRPNHSKLDHGSATKHSRPGGMQLQWRIGQYKKAAKSPTLLQIGNGASDPFSASPFSIDFFHQHLLPLAKVSYIYQQLQYVVPELQDPGSRWIYNMVSSDIHGAYLFCYGLSQRVPYGAIPQASHEQAHLGNALTVLRQGIESSRLDQPLAELNLMLAAHAYYNGRLRERALHGAAASKIIQTMGGLGCISSVLRAVYLVSAPIPAGKGLVPVSFPSDDFDVPAWDSLPDQYKVNIETSEPPRIALDSDLDKLFREHVQFNQVYRQRNEHRRTRLGSYAQADPVQAWLDSRFHVLNMISVETYLSIYMARISDVSGEDAVRVQINGVLALAVSHCHQFIYHHTRTKTGLFGEHAVGAPMNTIAFVHLRSHLKGLFELESFDLEKDYPSILWAVFVLACCEQVESVRLSESSLAGREAAWAQPVFRDILHGLPVEQRGYHQVRELCSRYLYDSCLDPFLMGLFM